MPSFQDITCPNNLPESVEVADRCTEVSFPDGTKDVIILARVGNSSIYDGVLQQDEDVSVLVIDTAQTHHRTVNTFDIRLSSCW